MSLSQLDCAFYTSFYEDLASLTTSGAIAINEHYLTVGKSQGRVANEGELNKALATILHFDDTVYSTANLSWNMSQTLKDAFGQIDWINHYYNPKNGNLTNDPRFRIINNNDLTSFSNKWEQIYVSVFEVIDFNLSFYRSFYDIPASINNTKDLQLDWLRTGMFKGQQPNLKAMNENRNVIVDVQSVLLDKFGLDMSMLATYKDSMLNSVKMNKIKIPVEIADDANSLLLFLLLNTGYQLRIFFNKNDLDTYKCVRTEQYNAAIASVKKNEQAKAIAESSKTYNGESIALLKCKKMVSVPIVKLPFSSVVSVLNVIKLSNDVFINCFKKIYKMEDLSDIIPIIAKHEMNNSLDPVLNSMEIKILVTSLVYNAFIVNKVDSKLYATFVKDTSISIISKMFRAKELTDFEASLEQDINYIIDNKKIVKLCYASNIALRIVAEAFLMGL